MAQRAHAARRGQERARLADGVREHRPPRLPGDLHDRFQRLALELDRIGMCDRVGGPSGHAYLEEIGARVALISPDDVKALVPHANVDGATPELADDIPRYTQVTREPENLRDR